MFMWVLLCGVYVYVGAFMRDLMPTVKSLGAFMRDLMPTVKSLGAFMRCSCERFYAEAYDCGLSAKTHEGEQDFSHLLTVCPREDI